MVCVGGGGEREREIEREGEKTAFWKDFSSREANRKPRKLFLHISLWTRLQDLDLDTPAVELMNVAGDSLVSKAIISDFDKKCQNSGRSFFEIIPIKPAWADFISTANNVKRNWLIEMGGPCLFKPSPWYNYPGQLD